MYKLFIIFFVASALLISCDKNNTVLTGYGSVELVFKARFDTLPLVYGNEYDYFGLGTLTIGTADFFYSSMKLLNAKDTVLVKDIDYISIMNHNKTIALAKEGIIVRCDSIPTGNYNALNFNIGVSDEQNKKTPADYPSSNPLSESSRYWTGWHSYIFTKTEGTFNNGTSNNFAYHSGFANSLRPIHIPQNFIIKDGQKTTIAIQIDYKKMFEVGGVSIDIPNHLLVQDTSSFMMSFLNQFQSAVSAN